MKYKISLQITIQYMTVWYLKMQYITVIYLTIQCNIVQYSTIHYYIVQYISIYYIESTIWYNILFSFISMLSLISHHLRQLQSSVLTPELLHNPGSTYRIWNNGQIFMFKVSERPFQSSRHDEIICRWHHNPPGSENLN